MEVQILSKKLIKPSTPTSNHLQNMKISFFDQIAPGIHVATILTYAMNGTKSEAETSMRLVRLEKSLSEILTLFYPLAGRYNKDNLAVDCHDQGVEFLHAEVNTDLSKLLSGDVKVEKLNPLVPRPWESALTPLCLIQVNEFECGGLALGIGVSHRIMDAATLSIFVKEWSAASPVGFRQETSLPPRFELPSFFTTRDVSWLKPIKNNGKKIVTEVFVFNGEALLKLKANAKELQKSQPSRVVFMTAILWGALIRSAKARNGFLRPSVVYHPVNLRTKTCLPISENACGNYYLEMGATFQPAETKEAGFHDLLSLISDAIKKTVTECAKPLGTDDVCAMASDAMKEKLELSYREDIDVFRFTSWCKLPFYEADFGWGNLSWVSSVHVPAEFISLMDTKDGDGIEACVHLNEADMFLLQQDQDIISYSCSLAQHHPAMLPVL